MQRSIKAFSIEELTQYISDINLPSFRAFQILSWLYIQGVTSYDEMTNIPKAVRAQLSQECPLHTPELLDKQESKDGSRKYLIKFWDDACVETVGMPSSDGRLTVCVSSQSGCAMGCVFCATGSLGLTRNLFPGEIVDQILLVQNDFNERVSNVVVMGQGEPFANYDSTIAALHIMNHEKLLKIGARHITVSTCGLLKGIESFSREPEQFTLAISLHSARQELRNQLLPTMKTQDLKALKDKLVSYSSQTGRRFSFEYALMKNVNDSMEDLQALVAYCEGLLCHVNLIPLNEIENSPFKPVNSKTLHLWQQKLEQAGIAASVRNSRGADIAAACGQLAKKHI